MKSKLLLSALTLTIMSSNAQNVNIPDANFKSYLINVANVDTDLNNEISVAEAQAYNGSLFMDNLGISDLTGLEAFVNVNHIQISSNPITSIDVSPNTGLNTLLCGSAELTSLALGSNSALRDISVSNASNLPSVDLSGCADLRTIYYFNSAINTLDVSNNLLLEACALGYCPISSIDLSMCPNLIEVAVSNMPQLTSLNVANGNNTSFTAYDATTYGFAAEQCANLFCVEVDDVAYSTATWTEIDPTISYSEDCASFVGIAETDEQPILVYPNPFVSELIIETNEPTSISVMNAMGEVVLSRTVNGRTGIDATNLSAGIYFVREETSVAVMKLVKN
ncbi:MAG: T9SS type A sorting domain-containing protein [Flavobacteriales bacterium]|nr:T9SS type A sorting domain-containing protein [Flavobacteriales bacterium]MCB9191713.1 T9SS type A sorting domain-containing protein [Flavobacteriales bacterium]MCB9203625.1 T9SS type A sorting domain-containing protein [Flavobacteriales bacterium]